MQQTGGGESGKTERGLAGALQDEPRLRNHSNKTIKAYRSWLRGFINYSEPKRHESLGEKDIRGYPFHLIEEMWLSVGSINQAFNAFRFCVWRCSRSLL